MTPTQKEENRKSIVMDIVIKKVKYNLDSKEFKETYGATKEEIKDIL